MLRKDEIKIESQKKKRGKGKSVKSVKKPISSNVKEKKKEVLNNLEKSIFLTPPPKKSTEDSISNIFTAGAKMKSDPGVKSVKKNSSPRYNWLELPRSIMKLDGIEVFKEDLGKRDKMKRALYMEMLFEGYKINSVVANGNAYLFLFEK